LQNASVIFDLDGTLLDGDSTSLWMLDRMNGSTWRPLLAAAGFLLALPLPLYPPSRRIGGSIFLWIASIGLSEAALHRSFAQFAEKVSAGKALAWRPGGLAELETRILRGKTALIATAAPTWLAERLVETLPFQVAVVGSSLSRFFGGWRANFHCRHKAKCDAITRAGYGERWAVAFSDSADDGPLLARAKSAFLVNASRRTAARIARLKVRADHVGW